MKGHIASISGPTVRAAGLTGCFMHEVVLVGRQQLLGEIIRIDGPLAVLQVYEETHGLRPGDPVIRSGELLSVELGPGLLGGVFDGIQRPLEDLHGHWGDFIGRGAAVKRLGRKRKWHFSPALKVGDAVSPGTVVGAVKETETVTHKIIAPPGVQGKIAFINGGDFTVVNTVAELDNGYRFSLRQRWNIREPRPTAGRLPFNVPLVTGQRVLDTLFPVAEGGSAIIPGGFGTGKTVLEQTIAKFANADIIVYVGCGERGNEMTDVLHEFPQLTDPYTGRPLMERTVLIANTSNMPVAAREASIYTGVTIAEYYRDMGYRVALLADSTSRWAEALREISSRLEEMPGEEGYPTYIASRMSAFYERAGRFRCHGRPQEPGSITIVGAVSPPGGDFSEPVTQASMRTASTFWALDYDLAYQRHFPAINWRTSYSLSYPNLALWYQNNVAQEWNEMVVETNAILQREEELMEIARIVGMDAMGEPERTAMEAARLIREGYLRQSAVHPTDSFCSQPRQYALLSLFLHYARTIAAAQKGGATLDRILAAPTAERLLRAKELDEAALAEEAAGIRRATAEWFAGEDA